MTGIGKTTLAERAIASLTSSTAAALPYYRFSLDDLSLTPDFANSGSTLLRTLGEEPTLKDQKDPVNLVAHILDRLYHYPCWVQIDSLERLLQGNEQDGWSEFYDPLWLDLLQKFLAGTNCSSQLLLTTQDIPADLDTVASRYPQFWHCEPLQSLSTEEQRTLFQNLEVNPSEADWDILQRIGAYYDGHPLALQVIVEELRQPPFRGNVALYWQHYEAEFTDTVSATANKLERSRLFRRRVRQRVEKSLENLPETARQMLCACSVFRRPVATEFWYAMLTEGDPQMAFDILQDRSLVDFVPISDNTLLVRQHNLIRSVAASLLKNNPTVWVAAERQAAELWLTVYTPSPDTSKLETVRGHLEAFEHYCTAGDWGTASEVYIQKIKAINQPLYLQLLTWGYFLELIQMSLRLSQEVTGDIKAQCFLNLGFSYSLLGNGKKAADWLKKATTTYQNVGNLIGEGRALNGLGFSHWFLGQYELAIKHHQQAVALARKMSNSGLECSSLGGLGCVFSTLGQYKRAIKYHRQCLKIAEETKYGHGKINALDGLGYACLGLGDFNQAIHFYQQALTISRKIKDRRSEAYALGGLGMGHSKLGHHQQAITFHQQQLSISHEISERRCEGFALEGLGFIHIEMDQYEKALDCGEQCLLIAQEISDPYFEGVARMLLGTVRFKLEQFSKSLAYNQAALKFFQEIGAKASEAVALKNLAELHQATGEVEMSLEYGQQALALAAKLDLPIKAECVVLLHQLETGEG